MYILTIEYMNILFPIQVVKYVEFTLPKFVHKVMTLCCGRPSARPSLLSLHQFLQLVIVIVVPSNIDVYSTYIDVHSI